MPKKHRLYSIKTSQGLLELTKGSFLSLIGRKKRIREELAEKDKKISKWKDIKSVSKKYKREIYKKEPIEP